MVGVLEVAGAVGLLIPLLSSLAALRLAAVMVGAAMTNQVPSGGEPVAAPGPPGSGCGDRLGSQIQ